MSHVIIELTEVPTKENRLFLSEIRDRCRQQRTSDDRLKYGQSTIYLSVDLTVDLIM